MGISSTRWRISCGLTLTKFSFVFRSLVLTQQPLPWGSQALTLTFVPLTPETNNVPPVARTANWLLFVETKSASTESAQTKEPGLAALARWPAAKLKFPDALFPCPPATVLKEPLAVLLPPPPTTA